MRTLLALILIAAMDSHNNAQQPQQPPCKENALRGCMTEEEAKQQHAEGQQQRAGQEKEVVFTWSYNYATIPVCSATVTTKCIHHFLLSEGSTAMVALAATTAVNYSYILRPLPSPGTHTYNLVAVEYLTGSADAIASPPAQTTVRCQNSRQCQAIVTP